MRGLKLLMLLGLVLAVSGIAEAVTIPALPTGVVQMSTRNQDNGTVYINTTAGAIAAFDPHAGPAPAGVTVIPASGAIYINEDSWGIANLYHIEAGSLIGGGLPGTTVNPTDTGVTYDNTSSSPQSTWLVAVFYGATDVSVSISAPDVNGNVTQTVYSSGLHFKLFAADKAAINAQAAGVAGEQPIGLSGLQNYVAGQRNLGGNPSYEGWAGNIPGEVLLLDGVSTYYRSIAVVNQTTGTFINATATLYLDIDENGPGLWDYALGTSPQLYSPNELTAPAGMRDVLSDAYFDWVDQPSSNNWLTVSRDNGGTFSIPEPMTMLGVFLGIGGLGGYIRRRRMA